MAALFFVHGVYDKPLAQSQGRCSHDGQCGYDRDDDRDNASVAIRFFMRQLCDGEHSNDRTTVWQ